MVSAFVARRKEKPQNQPEHEDTLVPKRPEPAFFEHRPEHRTRRVPLFRALHDAELGTWRRWLEVPQLCHEFNVGEASQVDDGRQSVQCVR